MATVVWELASDDPSEWDEHLVQASDHNVFQSHSWGEMKRKSGWRPLRLVAEDSGGNRLGQVQILQRKIANFAIGWAPGGPLLGFPDSRIGRELSSLITYLDDQSGLLAVRLDCYMTGGGTTGYEFRRLLRRARESINSGFTSWLDLRSMPQGEWLDTKEHRRILRQGDAAGVSTQTVDGEAGVTQFIPLYELMRRSKDLKGIPDIRNDVTLMGQMFGHDVFVVIASESRTAISSALVLKFGKRAFYVGGATSPRGRKLSAGHIVFHHLFRELSDRGVEEFDLGGLDPSSNQARGVDLFKLGLGGVIQERVGEWDWTKNGLTHLGFNLAMRLRGARG